MMHGYIALEKAKVMMLPDFLEDVIFIDSKIIVADPDDEMAKGYEKFMENYNGYLKAEYAAVQM